MKAFKEICPCKDCNVRTSTCHSICKEYKDWKKSGREITKDEIFKFVNFKVTRRIKRR